MGERRSQSSGVEFVLQAPTLEMLREVLPTFVAEAQANPVFTFVDSDLKFSSPEVQVSIDRERAQALGVSVLDIAQTVQAGMSGQRFGHFIHDGKQYDVIGQLTRDLRSRPDDLGNLGVRTMDGSRMVSLDNLISIREIELAARAAALQPLRGRDGVGHARCGPQLERRHRGVRGHRRADAGRALLDGAHRARRATSSKALRRSAGCSCSRSC